MKYLIISLIALSLYGCFTHGEDKTNKESVGNYDKICIEGHVYYTKNTGHKHSIAVKLDEYGKPVKCNE